MCLNKIINTFKKYIKNTFTNINIMDTFTITKNSFTFFKFNLKQFFMLIRNKF
jgi:hypothetical protein